MLRLPLAVADVQPAREVMAEARRVLMAREQLTKEEALLEIQHRARRERRTMARAAAAILGGESSEAP